MMNLSITIPSQGWYNLVVYDLTPKGLKNALINLNEGDDQDEYQQAIEKGITYIGDRLADESYSENPDYPDDEPSKEDLKEKLKVLKEKKSQLQE